MKSMFLLTLCYVALFFGNGAASASCTDNGERTQMVWLSSGGKPIDRWEVSTAEIHRTRLANGFELGLKIEPATPEKYRELLNKFPGIDELVKISVLDMSDEQPKVLTTT